METNFNPFNFREFNTEKKFSLLTKTVAIAIVIMFIMIPLNEISPEIFVNPKTVYFYEDFTCPPTSN